MKNITQGTLLYGMRSAKYHDIVSYGVIISAACDLAQGKKDKVFYLTAIPLKEWLQSESGFRCVTIPSVTNCRDKLLKSLEKYELSWEVVQTLSLCEFETIVTQYITADKEKTEIIKQFTSLYRLTKENLTSTEETDIFRFEKKAIAGVLSDIFNGKNTQYVFLPTNSISECLFKDQGIIIDLLELDYLSLDIVEQISDGKIDCNTLSDSEAEEFDKRFFIKNDPGYVYPVGEILSPWREYLLQHFSNCFIRIGIDNPGKGEAKRIIETLFFEEEST